MRALGPMALGVVIVGMDFRLNAPDVLADPLGWLLIALGAWLLAAKGASVLALVAAPFSVAGVWLTYRMVLVETATNTAVTACPADGICFEQLRYDDLGPGRALALLGAAVAGGVALAWVLRILRTEVGDTTKQIRLRQHLRVLEILVLLIWSLPVVILTTMAVIRGDGYDPVWSESLEPVGFIRFVFMAWLAGTLLVFADRYPRPTRAAPS